MEFRSKNKKSALIFCGIAIIITAIVLIKNIPQNSKAMICGGTVYTLKNIAEEIRTIGNLEEDMGNERFRRPSKQEALPNKYTFHEDAEKLHFTNPEEAVYAYYGILQEASNMEGYSGGCGTIGNAKMPYPSAYQLLTQQRQKELSLQAFINSFSGIGYTTFLKIYPAYLPPGTPQNIKYFMVEIEIITGKRQPENKYTDQISHFAYYYGIVTVENEQDYGWKIQNINYLPENFLCAPYHGWVYSSKYVINFVYRDGLQIVEKIEKTEQKGDYIQIYASGKGQQYRFDFVRLTNGYDILLHEYILEDGHWKEVSLLTNTWEKLKFSIKTFELNNET